MNAWIESLNTMAATWFDSIVRASWQGGLALAVVWLIARFVSRLPAAHKVWLWRIAFLKLLAALVWFSPVMLPVLPQPQPSARPFEQTMVAADGPKLAAEVPLPATVAQVVQPPTYFPGIRAWLLLAWWAALFLFGFRLLRQWRQTRCLLRRSMEVRNATVDNRLRLLAERLRLRRKPLIFESEAVSSPVLVGILRPRIVLPRLFPDHVSSSRLELMLAHELAHLRRNDLLWQWLFAVAEALFFFHPLVWLARREWTLATEAACDELAICLTRQTPRAYGEMLVDVVAAASRRERATPLLAVGIIENANTLKRRLKLMITTRTYWSRIGGIALIAVATLALIPWKLTAQTADADAFAKLKEENARLREQLEAMRKDAEQMRADAERFRKRSLEERQSDAAFRRQLAQLAERQSRSAHDQARHFEHQHEAMEKLQAEIEELRARFTEDHPDVRRKTAELERMKERFAELQKRAAALNHDRQSGAHYNRMADPRLSRRHEQQRELLQKEIELAERHAEYVRKALENGKEIPASLLAAQRELLDAKLQLARLSHSKADQRAVLLQQLHVAEGLLKEQRKRVEVGTLSSGAEIPFEREVLRIKRELSSLDGPDLEN